MLLDRLQKFFTAPTTKTFNPRGIFWFALSITFAATYGLIALKQAFRSEYVIEDDVRVFVFWLQQFSDRALLPNDFIVDYYKSVTPPGYAALYQLMAALGIDAILLSKLLPLFLMLIATGYGFALCMEILPVPAAGFIATLLLNQNVWMKTVITSTPRGFVYVLLPAFGYYLLRRSLIPCLVVIILEGLIYPPFEFIIAGVLILRLLRWENGRPGFSQERSDYIFCAAGLGVAVLAMLPYALSSSQFGPTISAAQARAIPEFGIDGRSPFFSDDLVEFFLYGWQSGLLTAGPFEPRWVGWTGFLLPILLLFPSRIPLASKVTSGVTVLLQMAIASLGMFFIAHAVLLKLYFPNRYTYHSLRILIALAAGMALILIFDAMLEWARRQTMGSFYWKQLLAMGVTILFGAALVCYPVYLNSKNYNFPRAPYGVVGSVPQLYEFFAKQPKDILIASLSYEADNLPTFAKRSILAGWEYANPYHLGYYNQIRQRQTDLIRAQYSGDLAEVKAFTQKYGVDFLLLDRSAFTSEYLTKNRWFKQWRSIAKEVQANLQQRVPALSSVVQRCSTWQNEALVVLPAECIVKAASK